MKIHLDIQNESSLQQFGDALLLCQSSQEALIVDLPDIPFCPNRIVPILGLADEARGRKVAVSFNFKPGTAAEIACRGYVTGDMSPLESEVIRPFGRVWRFTQTDELNRLVNAMEIELNRTAELAKGVKIGFVWCLNEVMDNVLNHSSKDGHPVGYVMVQYLADQHTLKVCVFDAGIGLLKSFQGSAYNPETPEEAISLAVQKNVTSGNGQGNGLYGLRCLVGQSPQGKLHIRSDGGEYLFDPIRQIENSRPSWRIGERNGMTAIDFQLTCQGELSFENVFPGAMESVDLWLERHEQPDGSLRLVVKDEVSGCGSRKAGAELRTVVINAIEADRRRVILDFSGVTICSSGFADELIGKLVLKYDFVAFTQLVSIDNLTGIPALLINHSLAQRMAERISGIHQETLY